MSRLPTEPTDLELLAALGARIALARETRGLTQSELSGAAGVSRSTIQRLEAGASTQLSNLLPVLRALGAARDLDRICPPARQPQDDIEQADRSPRDRGWRWGGGE